MFIITIEVNKNKIGRQEKVKYKRIIGLQYTYLFSHLKEINVFFYKECSVLEDIVPMYLQQQNDNTEGQ